MASERSLWNDLIALGLGCPLGPVSEPESLSSTPRAPGIQNAKVYYSKEQWDQFHQSCAWLSAWVSLHIATQVYKQTRGWSKSWWKINVYIYSTAKIMVCASMAQLPLVPPSAATADVPVMLLLGGRGFAGFSGLLGNSPAAAVEKGCITMESSCSHSGFTSSWHSFIKVGLVQSVIGFLGIASPTHTLLYPFLSPRSLVAPPKRKDFQTQQRGHCDC